MQVMTITDFKAHALRTIGQVAVSKGPMSLLQDRVP